MIAKIKTSVGEKNFIVDTGAGCSVISTELAIELKCMMKDSVSVKDVNGHLTRMVLTKIPELNLGGYSVKNTQAIVWEENPYLFSCLDVDGILGGTALQELKVRFSLRDSCITFGKTLDELGPFSKNTPMKVYGIQKSGNIRPIIFFTIQDSLKKHKCKVPILFDTGARYFSISCWNNVVKKKVLRNIRTTKGISSSIGMSAKRLQGEIRTGICPILKIGKNIIRGLRVSGEHTSLIGTCLLEFGDFIIDYPKRKAYFESFQKDQMVQNRKLRCLRNIEPFYDKEQGFIIGTIWDSAIQNIAVEDKIVEVNGKSTEKISICDAMELRADSIVVKNNSGLHKIAVRNIE
ncbi:MAG: clan AA aspartic protease [Alistipes sp.]|nr:clan AA aspartic protease [Candidatus Alistipes equi]